MPVISKHNWTDKCIKFLYAVDYVCNSTSFFTCGTNACAAGKLCKKQISAQK